MLDFIDQKRAALLDHLRRNVDGEVRFDEAARKLYSTDASIYQIEPLGVVMPRTIDALATAVQIAVEMHVPIMPRGGGTSLSGQSIGAGVVIDCSKYLNRILDIDPAGMTARVQPGVVLDQLNRAAAVHGLHVRPGCRHRQPGQPRRHDRQQLGRLAPSSTARPSTTSGGFDVILTDGSRAELGPLSAADWRQREDRTFLGAIYRGVRTAVEEAAPEIAQRFPRILRRVSGYNLDAMIPNRVSR